MIGLLTETIGNPTPMEIPFVPQRALPNADLPYPIAPQTWHFRQSIDYSVTANRAVLDLASRHREQFLYNIYQMGRNSIAKGNTDTWTTYPTRVQKVQDAIAKERGAQDAPLSGAMVVGGFMSDAPTEVLRHAARPGAARPARLHPAVGSARLSHRDEVRQRAGQDRHHHPSRHRAVQGRRQEVSRRDRSS